MASGFSAAGMTGQVRLGGRMAAKLGRWKLEGGGNPEKRTWVVTADIFEEMYWLTQPGDHELRLDVGKRIWRFKGDLQIMVSGRSVTITGSGRPDQL